MSSSSGGSDLKDHLLAVLRVGDIIVLHWVVLLFFLCLHALPVALISWILQLLITLPMRCPV